MDFFTWANIAVSDAKPILNSGEAQNTRVALTAHRAIAANHLIEYSKELLAQLPMEQVAQCECI